MTDFDTKWARFAITASDMVRRRNGRPTVGTVMASIDTDPENPTVEVLDFNVDDMSVALLIAFLLNRLERKAKPDVARRAAIVAKACRRHLGVSATGGPVQ